MNLETPVKEELERVTANCYEGYQVDFDTLCQRVNARVYDARFEDPDVSGLVRKEPDGTFSIYINSKHSEVRKRFTLAHEIGHIISYRAHSYSLDKLSREGFIERKQLYKVTEVAETEANELAAEILMPKSRIEDCIATSKDPTIESVAKTFGVSTAAMSIRLERLGYVES